MPSIRKPLFWKGFFDLIRILKMTQPDIVHTYLNTANVFGVIASKIAGIPRIITSRRDMGHFRSKRIALLERILNNWTTKIICVSNAVKKSVIVSLENQPRMLQKGVEVLPWRMFIERLWSGEFC